MGGREGGREREGKREGGERTKERKKGGEREGRRRERKEREDGGRGGEDELTMEIPQPTFLCLLNQLYNCDVGYHKQIHWMCMLLGCPLHVLMLS